MFTIFDQWLARLFGASRRDRSVPLLAQRAYYGHDGMDLRQIDSYDRSFDFGDAPAPYQRYVRMPRSAGVLMDSASALAPAPVADALADLEAAAALKSRQMLQGELNALKSETASAPEVWNADPNRVRFTRTPDSFLQRRRDEEEAKARAVEEESRRLAEAARARAEEAARRAEEDARRLDEAKQAIARAMRGARGETDEDEAPRVRFARTPDLVFQARARQKDPPPPPLMEAEVSPEPAPAPSTSTCSGRLLRHSPPWARVSRCGPSTPCRCAAPPPRRLWPRPRRSRRLWPRQFRRLWRRLRNPSMTIRRAPPKPGRRKFACA